MENIVVGIRLGTIYSVDDTRYYGNRNFWLSFFYNFRNNNNLQENFKVLFF